MYIFKYSLEVSTKYLIEALTFNFLGNYIRAFTGTPNKVAILRQVSCFHCYFKVLFHFNQEPLRLAYPIFLEQYFR